jgi:DNA replication protein DnaC
MRKIGESGLIMPDEALKSGIINTPVYDMVMQHKREHGLNYENDLCYIGFMVSGIKEGGDLPTVQSNWDALQKEITSPGYNDVGGGFDRWSKDHIKKRSKQIMDEAQAELKEDVIRKCLESARILLARDYQSHMMEKFDTFKVTSHEHQTRLNDVYQISKGPDTLQFWHGPTNRGKTHLLVSVLKAFAKRGETGYIYEYNYIAGMFSKHITDGDDGARHTTAVHMRNLDKYKILLIDEFNPDSTGGAHISGRVFDLIERRINKRLKTVFVSNLEYSDMYNFFGKRRNSLERRVLQYGRRVDFNTVRAYQR